MYQDLWVRGERETEGLRECENRYGIIKSFLSQFERPFTVLDLGADMGYFSFRIAEDFPQAVCVMVDTDEKLLENCEDNGLSNVIYLRKRMTAKDLNRMAECEHFDVVLALSVAHHFPAPIVAVRAIMRLGIYSIFEVPTPEDKHSCGQAHVPSLYRYLKSLAPILLGSAPSHVTEGVLRPIWAYHHEKLSILKPYLGASLEAVLGDVRIDSSFQNKEVYFQRKEEKREWYAGINLRTFQCMNGVYPKNKIIIELLKALQCGLVEEHGDIAPWNFILSGEKLSLIDKKDEGRNLYDDTEKFKEVIEAFS